MRVGSHTLAAPVERRGWVTHGVCWVNGRPEELSCLAGRRQPSLSGTSRMRRESHVRICERLGVRFPGPTRLFVFEPVMRTGSDGFLMMSTSGTTGAPKGVLVPLEALLTFRVYMTDGIDLRPEDSFWNIADPGWAYGLYYAVTGPLMLGCATTFYDGPFTVESAYRMIADYGVTNLAGAPTAFRLLMAAGDEPAKAVKGQLRVVSSAGEPLN